MTSTIQELRAAHAALVTQREEIEQAANPTRERLEELTAEVDEAKAVLWDQRAYTATKEAAQRELDALRPRVSQCTTALQDVDRQLREVDDRMRNLNARIERAEYDEVSVHALSAAGDAIAADIRAIDGKLRRLADERAGMQQKREQAESQLESVAEAEGEAQAARDALKTAQGDAFIADQGADLAPHTARLSKAEKRLASANEGAALARAALPRIEARTAEIDAEIAEVHGERAERVASWWTNRARIADKEFTARVSGLAEALRDRIACDTRTRANVGTQLLRKMQETVHIPVMGRHTEAVNWRAWFGYEQSPDVADTVDLIDAELQTAIAGEG